MTSTNLPALLETLPTVKSQTELNQALQNLKQHFNVLVPAQMNFSSPLHKVALEAVQLDPTVDGKKNGIDIYSPDGTDKYTLHYKAANKIAGAAGINWTKSYAAKRETGDDGRVIYVEHVVEYEVKKTNGSTKKGVMTGHYRYEEDKARFSANPKQIETRRRFAEGLAESNAKLRAIFEALEQLPRSFTLDEIKKPFLVPCVVEDINELAKDDPEIRRMIAANSLGILDKIYGKDSSKSDPKEIHGATAEVIDERTLPTQTSQASQPTQADIEKQNIEIWTGMTAEQRYKELVTLANKIGKPLTFEPVSYTTAPVQRQLNGLLDFYRQSQKQSTETAQPAPLPGNW
jgi:hypothetical protein